MEQLVIKYAKKLSSAGLAPETGPLSPLVGGLDDLLVWNRPGPEIPVLEQVFEGLNINSLVFLRPQPPYDRIIRFLARHALDTNGLIQPKDCETRTFLHDLPVVNQFTAPKIIHALKQRKSVIIAQDDAGFPGPAIIAHGTVSPEQGFVVVSSVCFACFVKFFADYLEALHTGSASQAYHDLFDALAQDLESETLEPPDLMKGPFSTQEQVYEALVQAGRKTVEYGLVDSYFGNLSYCMDQTLYISQTGSSLDELEGCIDPVPLDGSSSAGLTASSELTAHLETIAQTGCQAILHGHPKFCVILSMDCDPKEKAACPFQNQCHTHCPKKRFINQVPIVSGEVGTGLTGLCNTLPKAFGSTNHVIVYGHGLFTIGNHDFSQAFATLLEVETRCRSTYFAKVHRLRQNPDPVLETEADPRLSTRQKDRIARKNYQRFLKFLPYPVLVRDEKTLVSYINPAFTQTFGWTLEELKGKEGRQYIPEHLQEELFQKIASMPPKNVLELTTQRITKEGKILDVIMRVGVDRDEKNIPTGMIIVLRDVTMENRINQNRMTMSRISQMLPQYPELGKLLHFVSMEIKELLGTEGANVILVDENQKEFYFLSNVHDDPGTRERIKKIRFPMDELLAGQVVKNGHPVMMNALPEDHTLHQNRDKKFGYKVKNVLVVPLRNKERIIGVIAADNKKQGDFDETDMETLNTIAGTVALSIENAGVSEELRKANEELIGLNAAKEKMISHLSHELKTPVAILLSSVKILSKKLDHLPEKTWEPTLERVRRNLDRIIGIEDEVYDIVEKKSFIHKNIFSLIFSQCEDTIEAMIAEEIGEKGVIRKVRERLDDIFSTRDPVVKKIYLNQFVETRLEALSPLFAHRNVEISVRLKASTPIDMPLDPLRKIIDGLIRNAIENTPDGGTIMIMVHDKGKGVEFIVQDHGIGLTQEAQRRIFEGFFTPQDTLNYSSRRPYDFGAGGKGADLLRMKIFSERYQFKIKMTSKRCQHLPNENDVCPGFIEKCRKKTGPFCDGKTTVSVIFPFPGPG